MVMGSCLTLYPYPFNPISMAPEPEGSSPYSQEPAFKDYW
jgi:hypothetical protein